MVGREAGFPALILLDPQWKLVRLALKHYLLELQVAERDLGEEEELLDWQSVATMRTAMHMALLSAQDLIGTIEAEVARKARRRMVFGARHSQGEAHLRIVHGCLAALPAILLDFAGELRATGQAAEAGIVMDLVRLLDSSMPGDG